MRLRIELKDKVEVLAICTKRKGRGHSGSFDKFLLLFEIRIQLEKTCQMREVHFSFKILSLPDHDLTSFL